MRMLFALLLAAAGAFVLVMGIRGSYWAAFGVPNPWSTQAVDPQHTAPSSTK